MHLRALSTRFPEHSELGEVAHSPLLENGSLSLPEHNEIFLAQAENSQGHNDLPQGLQLCPLSFLN